MCPFITKKGTHNLWRVPCSSWSQNALQDAMLGEVHPIPGMSEFLMQALLGIRWATPNLCTLKHQAIYIQITHLVLVIYLSCISLTKSFRQVFLVIWTTNVLENLLTKKKIWHRHPIQIPRMIVLYVVICFVLDVYLIIGMQTLVHLQWLAQSVVKMWKFSWPCSLNMRPTLQIYRKWKRGRINYGTFISTIKCTPLCPDHCLQSLRTFLLFFVTCGQIFLHWSAWIWLGLLCH